MKWLLLSLLASSLWAGSEQQGSQAVNPDSLYIASGQKNLVEDIYDTCKQDNLFENCVEIFLDDQKNKKKVEKFQQQVGRNREWIPKKQRSKQQDLLAEYLQKRFQEKVYGKDDEQRIVDHALFFDLYQSQLAKMVTLTINSYCMYADQDNFGWNRSNNNKAILNDRVKAPGFIDDCITNIKMICHSDQTGDSKQRACQVMQDLRKLNRAIAANQKRIDYFKGKNKTTSGLKGLMEVYGSRPNDPSIDDLTSLTSSEFQKNVMDKIEAVCPEGQEPSEKCLEQLKVSMADELPNTHDEDKEKIEKEFQIQTIIVSRKIASYQDKDIEQQKEYLKQEIAAEGGTEDIIQKIEQASDDQINALRNEMKKRYKRERAASLELLRQNLAKIADSPKKVVNNLKDKSERLGQLLFFNNVITGYLSIKNEGGQIQGRNIASFKRELEQAEDGRLPASLELEEKLENFQETLAELERDQKAKEGSSSTTIGPDQIYGKVLGDKEAYQNDEGALKSQ